MSESGNALVTELLLKSAYYCPLRTVQSYANRSVSSSLSVSLQQLRFFFIFFDKLQCKQRVIALQAVCKSVADDLYKCRKLQMMFQAALPIPAIPRQGLNQKAHKKGRAHHCGRPSKLESYKKTSYFCSVIIFIPSSTACIFRGIMP